MNTFRTILIALLTIPVVELYILVQAGSLIGVLPTVLLVVGTGIAGAYLFHTEGLATWLRLQNAVARGEIPTTELVEGPLVLLGGILLLTPGFLTDLAGLVCLLPQSRRWLAEYLLGRDWLQQAIYGWKPNASADSVIEGEFRKEDN